MPKVVLRFWYKAVFHAATHESDKEVLRNGETRRRGGVVGEGGVGGYGAICCSHMGRDLPSQDGFRKVKISRALEPFLPSGGGVVMEFGEGEDEGEEGWGVEVPP